jgi:hypothetical protein
VETLPHLLMRLTDCSRLKHSAGRVAQPFDHLDAPNKVGAPLFAFCAKVGAMPHAAPILTFPKSGTSNSIIPALANNARTGHPPL